MNRNQSWSIRGIARTCGFAWTIPICQLAFAGGGGTPLTISEIRIDQPSTDDDEYFELAGPAGLSLTGYAYIVIGEGTAAQGLAGVIESWVRLDGQSIGPSGYFVVAEPTFTLGTADFTPPGGNQLNFENNDTVTHLLVEGFTGSLNMDLDTNNDGVLDVTPWTSVLDGIAVIAPSNPPSEPPYWPVTIGPEGTFTPGYIYRGADCNQWQIGTFDTAAGDDSPGAANLNCPPPPVEYYFGLPHESLGDATLSTGATGELVIDNLGSSGQDGVSIQLTDASCNGCGWPGWEGEVDCGPAGALAAGIEVKYTLMDSSSDPVAIEVAFRETNGGQAAVSFDRAVCDPCLLTVELINNGAVVDSMTYSQPYPPELVVGALGSSGGEGVRFSFGPRQTTSQDGSFSHGVHIRNSMVAPMTLTGSPTGPVDTEIIALRLNGLPPGIPVKGTLMQVTGTAGPITVSSEALLKAIRGKVKEVKVEALSLAHMGAIGDLDGDGLLDIAVTNIGSSGNDGVRLSDVVYHEFGHSSISAELDWGAAGALPPGSVMRFTVENDQQPSVQILEMAITETGGGQGALSLDCAGCVGGDGVIVALHNGVVVDSIVVSDPWPTVIATGSFGSSYPSGSKGEGVTYDFSTLRACEATGNPIFVSSVRNSVAGLMSLTGSPTGPVMADTIEARKGANEAAAIGALRSISTAQNLTQFSILDASLSPEADFGSGLEAFGLPHGTFGGADLSVGADGSLIVRDMDDDGDGASIQLGQADGWAGYVDIWPAGDAPPDAQVAFEGAEKALLICVGLAVILADKTEGHTGIIFQQDVCNPCQTQVRLLNGNMVVAEAIVPSTFADPLVTGAIGTSPSGQAARFVWHSAHDLPTSPAGAKPVLRIFNPAVTPMTLPGQPPVDANQILITVLPVEPGDDLDLSISALDLTGDGLPDLALAQERMIQFGNEHEALGQARMCSAQPAIVENKRLLVGNIGSSGQDGVTISHDDDSDDDESDDDLEEMSVTFDPVVLPPTSSMAINTKGTGAQGGLAAPVAFDAFLKIEGIPGESTEITVDFSQLGSTTHTAEVYNGGVLMGSLSGQSGPLVATVPDGTAFRGVSSRIYALYSTQKGARTIAPQSFSFPTGEQFVGDELRVIAENPTLDVNAITSMSLTGTNLGQLTIVDQTIAPVDLCPADIAPTASGGDGAVNVKDLLAVIASWGPCPAPCPRCAADLAPPGGNCVVNVSDLLYVIANWGQCPQ